MKLAFSTVCCPEWDWQKCAEYAGRYGFDGVELRITREDAHQYSAYDGTLRFPEESPLRGILTPPPVMLATSVCLTEDCIGAGRLLMETARRIGTPMLRVMIADAPNPTVVDLTAAAMAYRTLFLEGKQQGLRVLIETSGILSDSAKMKRFLLLADCGGEILWDVHNTFRYCGEDPGETFRELRDRISYVHIKDSRLSGKRVEHCQAGTGDIPIQKAVRLLAESNFDGFLSCEWVRRWNPLLSPPWIVLPDFVKTMRDFSNK